MKKLIIILAAVCFYHNGIAQEKEKRSKEKILAEVSESGCKCIDSINVYDKNKDSLLKEIAHCIDKQTIYYQMAVKLMDIDSLAKNAPEKDGNKEIKISMTLDMESKEYKMDYYEIESYMMENCQPLKTKVAVNNTKNAKSYSSNAKALDLYAKGVSESEKENYKEALKYYLKAVKVDPEFAFAWDNIGICYRKMDDYDNALMAYNKSLEIDPKGLFPLQNIAIVYQYKKEYTKALDAYERLAALDKNNPETYYGIGQIYTVYLQDYEKGLENMCKAYNLYVSQKSAYRTDAEKLIQMIYTEMKKQGKEEKFNSILKENNISPN